MARPLLKVGDCWNESETHADRLTEIDDGIGDLAQDLKDKGLWNQAVIMLVTEFGRRNFVNGILPRGTRH